VISLSDRQLNIVMTAAAGLPIEKRDAYLQRVAARLQADAGTSGHPSDAAVDRAVRAALAGLVHAPAA
jgi:hypothetical protein